MEKVNIDTIKRLLDKLEDNRQTNNFLKDINYTVNALIDLQEQRKKHSKEDIRKTMDRILEEHLWDEFRFEVEEEYEELAYPYVVVFLVRGDEVGRMYNFLPLIQKEIQKKELPFYTSVRVID